LQVEFKASIGVLYAEGMADIVKGHAAITNRKDTKHCDISVRVLEPSKVHDVPPAEDVCSSVPGKPTEANFLVNDLIRDTAEELLPIVPERLPEVQDELKQRRRKKLKVLRAACGRAVRVRLTRRGLALWQAAQGRASRCQAVCHRLPPLQQGLLVCTIMIVTATTQRDPLVPA
jgi:hypothetical protein